MCEPISLGTGLGIASSAAGAVGAYQQAQGQRAALEASARQRAAELSDQQEVELGERVRAGRRERARLRVAAGEAGLALSSGSFEAQIADSFSQQGQDAGNIRFRGRQSERSLRTGVNAQAASIVGDSPLALAGAGLQIAGSGLSGYQQGLSIRKARRQPTE